MTMPLPAYSDLYRMAQALEQGICMPCHLCHGTGKRNDCPACLGSGWLRPCGRCKGEGSIPQSAEPMRVCRVCDGHGFTAGSAPSTADDEPVSFGFHAYHHRKREE